MVSTRRQSTGQPTNGAAEPTNNYKSAEAERDDIDMYSQSELSELSDASESESDVGSDWGTTTKRKGNGRSPAKRTKLTDKGSPSTAPVLKITRGRQNISLLLTMPLDVIYSVFALLPLKDLVSLTRTNKMLRQNLWSINATTVWKSARAATGAPIPPQDFSEPRWATLLFGGSTCQCCGRKNIHSIDFALRRRLCTSCKKDNYVVETRFSRRFPDFDKEILEFILYTNTGGWSHGHASNSRFFWADDVDDIARKWAVLQSNVHKRCTGAKKKLEDFRSERRNFVARVLKEASEYDIWERRTGLERSNEIEAQREARQKAIRQKFRDLGYIDGDISAIYSESAMHASTELTERGWARIRHSLEETIILARKRRLAYEHDRRVRDRTYILTSLYNNFLKTLVPLQWLSYPRPKEVVQFPIFKELIEAEHETVLTPQSFVPCFESLPTLIEAWMEEKRVGLRQQITATQPPVPADASTTMTTPDVLDLATAIFKCGRQKCLSNLSLRPGTHGNPFFGWEGASTHACKEREGYCDEIETSTVLKYCEEGSGVAAALVRLAGLDETRTTVEEMDERDPFFFCPECPTGSTRRVYGWRLAVVHAASGHAKAESWQLLTPEQAALSGPPTDPANTQRCWSCNHCSTYFNAWSPKQTVLEHLRTHHDIQDPKEPRDIFSNPALRRTPPNCRVWHDGPLGAKSKASANGPMKHVKCQHCKIGKNAARLFDIHGVKNHLKAKHGVHTPEVNGDYLVL